MRGTLSALLSRVGTTQSKANDTLRTVGATLSARGIVAKLAASVAFNAYEGCDVVSVRVRFDVDATRQDEAAAATEIRRALDAAGLAHNLLAA